MPHAAEPPSPWVWVPHAERVELETANGRWDLERQTADGWWRADVSGLAHGDDYAYRIDGGPPRPDPRSRWQPAGVHAASRLYDQAKFALTVEGWRARGPPGTLAYELHAAPFTADGPFDGAIERRDHLVD